MKKKSAGCCGRGRSKESKHNREQTELDSVNEESNQQTLGIDGTNGLLLL